MVDADWKVLGGSKVFELLFAVPVAGIIFMLALDIYSSINGDTTNL